MSGVVTYNILVAARTLDLELSVVYSLVRIKGLSRQFEVGVAEIKRRISQVNLNHFN